jgi:uncharacterized SAM-binding protein YcdF (DUF218 family)
MTMETAALLVMGLIALYALGVLLLALWTTRHRRVRSPKKY